MPAQSTSPTVPAAPTDSLTIVGNYVGQGGQTALEHVSGRRWISLRPAGDRTGARQAAQRDSRFTNAGGPGALTTGDGILVVDAVNGGTTVPGAFAGFAAAGPYEYLLYRGGSRPAATDDLFLRSSLQPVPSEPLVPGGNPVPPAPTTPDRRGRASARRFRSMRRCR